MDKDLIHVLERIANAIEESNDTLSAIASHYDSVVPVMKRNAVRAEEHSKELERGFTQQVKDIFRPQENQTNSQTPQISTGYQQPVDNSFWSPGRALLPETPKLQQYWEISQVFGFTQLKYRRAIPVTSANQVGGNQPFFKVDEAWMRW